MDEWNSVVDNVCKRLQQHGWTTWVVISLVAFALGAANLSAQDDSRHRSRAKVDALPLPSRNGTTSAESNRPPNSSATQSILGTAITLAAIAGAAVAVVWWLKRSGFRGPQALPTDALEHLGRRVLEPKVTVHLVRLGSRVLLLGSSPDGVRTLSEITDSTEVDQLISACNSTSSTAEADQPNRPQPGRTQIPSFLQKAMMLIMAVGLGLFVTGPAYAQPGRSSSSANWHRDAGEPPVNAGRQRVAQQADWEKPAELMVESSSLTTPQQLGVSLKMLALMTVFSLAPSILMMTTCFVRLIVVLGLLRHALGTQHGMPNQVLSAICLFLTVLVMAPVWQRSYDEGIRPYTSPGANESQIDEVTALGRMLNPVRQFMSHQIDKSGNADAVWMLLDFQKPQPGSRPTPAADPQSYDDVSFLVLAPAYMLSELKVGFLIGFQLFLPFLVIDFVVAMVLATLGLNMLPPSVVSLPLKLMLFVLIDGWFLTVGMLLESIQA